MCIHSEHQVMCSVEVYYIRACIQYFRYAVFNEDGTLAELKVSHMISGVCVCVCVCVFCLIVVGN